ncbi:filament-like plant protein [Musa acuminata AAA Group]|uniref:filament-like plant protein n=1 Tax=Musa acuminata AAA Group TaxID=214697 RepID=UPI0031E04558
MDRRSWLWRRKSSDKSPGETESSGSVSSEKHSGEPEALMTSSINSSLNHAQSPEVSSKDVSHEVNETIKNLNEKLSAALLNISAKEDLVKQHVKLAEEALLVWENAEKNVLFLKKQLKDSSEKNSSLEDRIVHLDAALKECIRQLRLTREEQEQKVHDAIIKKTNDWESEKTDLEIRLNELQAQLQAKAEITTSFDHELHSTIKALKEENFSLKAEIATLAQDLQIRASELEFSTRTAETASKQHLSSIKKVAKLESECRRLQAAARKSLLANEHSLISNSHYVESVTDSQSDAGKQLLNLDIEQSCSDSWASALIMDLDQFRKEKANVRNLTNSVEIDLMDDFLEMERLVALPEGDHVSDNIEHDADLEHSVSRNRSSRKEVQTIRLHIAELEEMIEKMNSEKVEMEKSFTVMNNQLKNTCDQLAAAEGQLVELQRQLKLVNEEKHVLEIEVEAAEGKKTRLGFQLESAHAESGKLYERVNLLDRKFEEEKKLPSKLKLRCQDMEATEAKRNKKELELESAYGQIAEFKGKISLLEKKLGEEKTLSTELASRCWKMDALKRKKEELECQLESANLELHKLHEKVNSFERKLEGQKAFSTELLSKCQNMEAIDAQKIKLECQLTAEHLEVGNLQEKVNILKGKLEVERALSSAIAANIEATEAKRKELLVQLELAHVENGSLQEKLATLGKQIEEERAISADFAAKCHSLEHELSSKQKAAEFHLSASSNRVLLIRQEKEMELAAGKLVACQKTILSLNQQLKILANFDNFMLETAKPELNGDLMAFRGESQMPSPRISPENLEISSALRNCKKSDPP